MFQSLHHILDVIENQPGWEKQQLFRRILTHWAEVVGTTVAAHARPTGINRGILWVATSSSVWAQELSYKRHLILQKLNHQFSDRVPNKSGHELGNSLNNPLGDQLGKTLGDRLPRALDTSAQEPLLKLLTDIKFSPARWQINPEDSAPVLTKHPSHLPSEITDRPTTGTWWQQLQDRSPHLPLCNQCHCPTPAGEIDRWGCCALCATKKWRR